ncbi:ABC transporter permease [Roseisolibacter sp. H3M3-2]|uniref:ABC transporter permease n=1 Tax=Roseisolibacter sp. H3M3-2 TaxID=3031323 RepID=UPI0023D9EF2D|nr:ABC transporter permease [Roseisolibacter sp. H3M3-2]MDF1505542.1 ABC transporter permease [Roseisolibacter sp. H3M3-2]
MSVASGPLARLRASAFWPMLRKEFVQMRRDRLTLGMMVVLPALQLALFGYAIRTEVRHLPTVVLDESRTQQSRALVEALAESGTFDVTRAAASRADVAAAIGAGEARAAIVVPPDYARALKRGRPARVQVLVDAAEPSGSSAAIAAAAQVGAAHGAELAAERAGRPAAWTLDVRVRPWYNPGLRSAVYIAPGLVGVLLSLTMLLIMSMAIVRERERGTLEQLIVTPIGKGSLMLGKVAPFVVVGYVQMSVVLLLGRLLFGVPARGSLPLLYALTFGFILANLGLGLLVSTLARTQAQAMQVGFFFLLPNILLSGFMFPREAMPAAARWVGLALPLTYYLRVLRGVLLRGVGLASLWREAVVLLVFAVAILAVSVRRFSKTLD